MVRGRRVTAPDPRELEQRGFVILRGLFAPQEARRVREQIIELSRAEDASGDLRRRFDRWEGVTRHRQFWPVIVHEPLLRAVRDLLGGTVRYVHNSEVHANNAGFLWHRDCIDQICGVGPDWDDSLAPYRVVRACIYLDSHEDNGFQLGVVPGSHRFTRPTLAGLAITASERVLRRLRLWPAGWDARRRPQPLVSTERRWRARLRPATPTWIRIGLGDCVVLHQRLVHSASQVRGPQHAIYFSYGPDDVHTRRQWHHYRHERPDREQCPVSPELAERLAAAQLLLEEDRDELSSARCAATPPARRHLADGRDAVGDGGPA